MAPKWKLSTLDSQDKYRRLYLKDAFGRRGFDKITRADVAKWFADVAERAGESGANRAMEILRAAFNKAEEWDVLPTGSDPTNGINRFPRKRIARFLRPDELARLGEALDRAAAARPMRVAALLLHLLTGCRRTEIIGLHWSVVGARLKLTDGKTGSAPYGFAGRHRRCLRRSLASRDVRRFSGQRTAIVRSTYIHFGLGFGRRTGFRRFASMISGIVSPAMARRCPKPCQ
jgi:integrase